MLVLIQQLSNVKITVILLVCFSHVGNLIVSRKLKASSCHNCIPRRKSIMPQVYFFPSKQWFLGNSTRWLSMLMARLNHVTFSRLNTCLVKQNYSDWFRTMIHLSELKALIAGRWVAEKRQCLSYSTVTKCQVHQQNGIWLSSARKFGRRESRALCAISSVL